MTTLYLINNFDFANAYTVFKAQGKTIDYHYNCLLERFLDKKKTAVELIYREELYTMISRPTKKEYIHFDYRKFEGKVFPSCYDERKVELVKITKSEPGAIYKITDDTGKCYIGQSIKPEEREKQHGT